MTTAPSQLIWKRFCQHRLAVVSAATLILLVFISSGAPLWVSVFDLDGQTVDLFNRFQPVSAAHPLGTDEEFMYFFQEYFYLLHLKHKEAVSFFMNKFMQN